MTDADRLRRLFEHHRTAVFRFALRRVGPDLAEEVLAETFLVAWRRLDEIPPDRELPWLLTTARLVLMNISRSVQRRDQLAERIGLPDPEPDHAARVAQSVDVHRALARLGESDQEVLRLVEWDGLSQADAATVMGCSPAALEVRLRRARARLAKALNTDPPARQPPASDNERQSKPPPSQGIQSRPQWLAADAATEPICDVPTGRSIQ